MNHDIPDVAATADCSDADVLIAGGGLVGMALATELGIRGVRCLVVEKRPPSKDQLARTNLMNARSMEHFRRWGIADTLRANDPIPAVFGRDVTYVTRLNGYVLVNMVGVQEWEGKRSPLASERPERIPNQAIERTLRDKVGLLPDASVLWNTAVTDFGQDEHGVLVQCQTPHGAPTLTAKYLVIADGARGSLRRKLNVGLPGESLSRNSNWLIYAPDLTTRFETPLTSLTLFVNEDGVGDFLTPQTADGHWMYLITPMPDGLDPDDWETIRTLLFRSVGSAFPVEPIEGGMWISQSRMAPRYDFGRVFLAGDAAHLTSPFGAFGGNMGIGDAVDLGWKLAATLQGWGGPRLLESYTIERQEAERFIIDGSAQNQSVLAPQLCRPHMDENSERGRRARSEVVELIITEKMREFRSLGAQLGYRYTASPIIVRDGTEASPLDYGEYVPSARPGNRVPHVWLNESTSLYDLLGPGFTLLKLAEVETQPLEKAARRLAVPLKVLELNDETVLDLTNRSLVELYEASLVLVRPDQHVGWRANELPDDCEWLLNALRGALGTHQAFGRGFEGRSEPAGGQFPTPVT